MNETSAWVVAVAVLGLLPFVIVGAVELHLWRWRKERRKLERWAQVHGIEPLPGEGNRALRRRIIDRVAWNLCGPTGPFRKGRR